MLEMWVVLTLLLFVTGHFWSAVIMILLVCDTLRRKGKIK